MRSKKYNELQPICAVENVPLFVLYIKKQLTTEQRKKVDKHLQECTDCKMNFAYVQEILDFKHPLTSDEKTLLLRYITDPLWYQSINDAKKHIREEILNDVRQLLKDSPIDLSNHKIESKNLSPNSSTTPNAIHKNKNTNLIHKMPSVTLTIALILVFSTLSTSIYLIINKQNTLSNSTTLLNSSSIATNKTTNTQIPSIDHYQQLDFLIDKYLESKNNDHLEKAESLAQNMKSVYSDEYAVDLVDYYKSASPSTISQMINYRKEMFQLINQPSGDNLEQRLKRSQKLEKALFEIGNKIEAYRVRTITSKAHLMVYNYDLFKSTSQEGLNFSQKHKYLFLEGHFLLWQAKHLSETARFEIAEKVFLQTLEIGKKIELEDLVVGSNISLATMYHLVNDNQKCLEIAQTSLLNPQNLKKTQTVTLMQLAGLAAANLKDTNLSNQYLNKSLELANQLKNQALIVRSYIFLSLTSAESKKFSDSDRYYSQAMESVDKLTDKTSKLTSLYVVTGYYAKIKFLEGNFDVAAKSYKQTLDTIQELKINNDLELGQLNEGLAMALTKLNQIDKAQQYLAIANHHRELAENNKQLVNCFLSFIPTNCSANFSD